MCCISLHTFFPCFYKQTRGGLGFDHYWQQYLFMVLFWLFGYILFGCYSIFEYLEEHEILPKHEVTYILIGFFMVLFLFVCFGILFFCLITPFILISLVYPDFLSKIASFFCLNFD